jgi:hypothetical protein
MREEFEQAVLTEGTVQYHPQNDGRILFSVGLQFYFTICKCVKIFREWTSWRKVAWGLPHNVMIHAEAG